LISNTPSDCAAVAGNLDTEMLIVLPSGFAQSSGTVRLEHWKPSPQSVQLKVGAAAAPLDDGPVPVDAGGGAWVPEDPVEVVVDPVDWLEHDAMANNTTAVSPASVLLRAGWDEYGDMCCLPGC
jgi:hypothetical protein